MATLKDLRVRIRSVRSTQKITSAMKMVAASRLRRAQEQAEAARPYSTRMERMLSSLAANLKGSANAPRLLAGTGKDDVHLLVVATSDRGLAGGFNSTILREARRTIRELERARSQPPRWRWRDFAENLCYLFFGQAWPANLDAVLGAFVVWSRWLWLPAVIWTLLASVRGCYRGREWLIALGALSSLLLLVLQQEGIMEGRYRAPIEPIFIAAIVLSLRARCGLRDADAQP